MSDKNQDLSIISRSANAIRNVTHSPVFDKHIRNPLEKV